MMSEIRVVVVADQPIFRAGVTWTLNAEPDLKVVGEGSSAADALRLVNDANPDVIVLDMNMAEDGIQAVEGVLAQCVDVKPLVLTGIVDNDRVCSAMQKGAWGYVLKGVSGPDLVQVVRIIHRGERYVSPALTAQLFATAPVAKAKHKPFAALTGREEKVLALIAEGLSNKEIGGRLTISEKTVKHYMTIILDKLNVRSRVQAALLASSHFKLVEH
jgi:DNA-binding NarL/FixJ family response regulator